MTTVAATGDTHGDAPGLGPTHSHTLHVYDNESVFLDTMEGFVAGGLRRGEAVIVIATAAHLYSLEYRLESSPIDTAALLADGSFVCIDAEAMLPRLMVDGRPDEALFNRHVAHLVETAQAGGRHVRVFGEMVALLWQRGEHDATLELERCWNKLCARIEFSYCAESERAFGSICNQHGGVADRSD
jgi:hypothetical protein